MSPVYSNTVLRLTQVNTVNTVLSIAAKVSFKGNGTVQYYVLFKPS